MLMGGYFGRYVSATQQRNKIGIVYTLTFSLLADKMLRKNRPRAGARPVCDAGPLFEV